MHNSINDIWVEHGCRIEIDVDLEVAVKKGGSFAEKILLLVNWRSNNLLSIVDVRTHGNEYPNKITVICSNASADRLDIDVARIEQAFFDDHIEKTSVVTGAIDAESMEEYIADGKVKVYGEVETDTEALKQRLVGDDMESFEYIRAAIL